MKTYHVKCYEVYSSNIQSAIPRRFTVVALCFQDAVKAAYEALGNGSFVIVRITLEGE